MLTIAGDYSMTVAARSDRTRLRRGLTGGVLSGFRENGLMAADDADPGTISRVRPARYRGDEGRMGFTGCGELLAPDSAPTGVSRTSWPVGCVS